MVFLYICALLSLLLSGAIFGFFYAWVCSTMWGLDMADPQIAIAAMQAMNASVRNMTFAPAFFGTPFALAGTAALAWALQQRPSATCFALAALIYGGGGIALTMLVNVPMNEALAEVSLPQSEATAIWQAYSTEWQFWNQTRTAFSGLSLILTGIGLITLGKPRHSA